MASLSEQMRALAGSSRVPIKATKPSSTLLALFETPLNRKRVALPSSSSPEAKRQRVSLDPGQKEDSEEENGASSDEESSSEEEENAHSRDQFYEDEELEVLRAAAQEALEASEEESGDEFEFKERPLPAIQEAIPLLPHEREKAAEAEEEAEKRERNMRTLFLGNLPTSAKKKDLVAACTPFGKIESVRFRSVPVASPKLPQKASFITKQFSDNLDDLHGYVVFVEASSAKAALALNGTILLGRHLRADLASQSKRRLDNDCSVFVGNLAFDTDDESLWSHFGGCGKVVAVRVVRDPQYRIGRGFGYVMFDSPLAVSHALKLDQKPLKDRPLRVTKSVRNKTKTPSRPSRGSQRGDSHSAGNRSSTNQRSGGDSAPRTRGSSSTSRGGRGERGGRGGRGGSRGGQQGSFNQVGKAPPKAPKVPQKEISFEGRRAVPGKAPRLTLPSWKKEEKKTHSGPRKPRHKKVSKKVGTK